MYFNHVFLDIMANLMDILFASSDEEEDQPRIRRIRDLTNPFDGFSDQLILTATRHGQWTLAHPVPSSESVGWLVGCQVGRLVAELVVFAVTWLVC